MVQILRSVGKKTFTPYIPNSSLSSPHATLQPVATELKDLYYQSPHFFNPNRNVIFSGTLRLVPWRSHSQLFAFDCHVQVPCPLYYYLSVHFPASLPHHPKISLWDFKVKCQSSAAPFQYITSHRDGTIILQLSQYCTFHVYSSGTMITEKGQFTV